MVHKHDGLCTVTMLSFLICLQLFFLFIQITSCFSYCLFEMEKVFFVYVCVFAYNFFVCLSIGWVQALVSSQDSDNAGPWEGPLRQPGLSNRLPSGQWPHPQPLWLRLWENQQESRGPACAGIIRIKSIPSFPYSSILHFHKFWNLQTI